MTLTQFNAICAAFPHATNVVQWGGVSVWKVGSKMFALGFSEKGEDPRISFKCSALSYEMLHQAEGCRPAPYLKGPGMTWIQRISEASLNDADLEIYLRGSYHLIAQALPKKTRVELFGAAWEK